MLTANSCAGGLSAYVTGGGPSIVMLHSLLSDRGSLEPLVPLLDGDFRLVLIDLPGFGSSPYREDDLGAQGERIAAAVRGFCGDETPILFGNGYGSFLALTVALRDPTAARGLLLAGCGASFSEEGRDAFRSMAAKAGEGGLSEIAEIAMRRLFPPDMAAKVPDIVSERRRSFLDMNGAVFREACHQLASLDLREEVRGLTVPVLACAGDLDEATPAAMAEELASLAPEGSFHLIPDCAHVPTLQAPRAVAALLRAFAADLAGRQKSGRAEGVVRQ